MSTPQGRGAVERIRIRTLIDTIIEACQKLYGDTYVYDMSVEPMFEFASPPKTLEDIILDFNNRNEDDLVEWKELLVGR